MNLMEITKGHEPKQNEQTDQTKNSLDTTDKWKQLAKEQAETLEKVSAERDELQVRNQKMNEFIQEFQERTHKLKMEKQQLFFENHEMQEEMQKSNAEIQQMTVELSEMRKLNQSLQQSNDDLRNRNGLMSRSEQELLEEEIKDVRDWNSKLQVQVNKSSVEAVDQAQQRQEEAEKQAKQAVAQVEREKKRADVEIQRANLNAKRQMDILKEKEYFWGAGYVTIILFSILKSSAFQRDLLDFFRVPIRWYCRFIEWLVIPTYDDGFGNQVAYQAGEAWLFRILALALFIIIGVISVLYIIEGIQIYKKQWDDISKLCFLSSLAGIVVLGDIIREWLPVNLLIIFLLINIAMMVLKMWMKKSFRSRK